MFTYVKPNTFNCCFCMSLRSVFDRAINEIVFYAHSYVRERETFRLDRWVDTVFYTTPCNVTILQRSSMEYSIEYLHTQCTILRMLFYCRYTTLFITGSVWNGVLAYMCMKITIFHSIPFRSEFLLLLQRVVSGLSSSLHVYYIF